MRAVIRNEGDAFYDDVDDLPFVAAISQAIRNFGAIELPTQDPRLHGHIVPNFDLRTVDIDLFLFVAIKSRSVSPRQMPFELDDEFLALRLVHLLPVSRQDQLRHGCEVKDLIGERFDFGDPRLCGLVFFSQN